MARPHLQSAVLRAVGWLRQRAPRTIMPATRQDRSVLQLSSPIRREESGGARTVPVRVAAQKCRKPGKEWFWLL